MKNVDFEYFTTYDGKQVFLSGNADIEIISNGSSSYMGDQWVTEDLRSHKVYDLEIEVAEDIETELPIKIDQDLYDFVEYLINAEEHDANFYDD
jgi:hypothetical protein